MSCLRYVARIPDARAITTMYSCFTYDGYQYYFVVEGMKMILNTNRCLVKQNFFRTANTYRAIYYDVQEKKFWAIPSDESNRIVKLNSCFEEIGDKTIVYDAEKLGEMTDISMNCCTGQFVISTKKAILVAEKASSQITQVYSNNNGIITGLVSLCPGYLLVIQCCQNQYIVILNESNMVERMYLVDLGYCICNMVFNPYAEAKDSIVFDCLARRERCPMSMLKFVIPSSNLGYGLNPCNYDICKIFDEGYYKPPMDGGGF